MVNFQGDGDFLMTGQELATAVQYALPIVTIIANNGMYGTIRMHQEREYPRRVIGTTLVNPDFAAYARSFGAEGTRSRPPRISHPPSRGAGQQQAQRDRAQARPRGGDRAPDLDADQ